MAHDNFPDGGLSWRMQDLELEAERQSQGRRRGPPVPDILSPSSSSAQRQRKMND
jgi:hypothetical protein